VRTANYLKAGLAVIIIIVGVLGALISCNRQFAVPVSAVISPTPTSTGGTGTSGTATNTATNTANGPTNTATNTATMTATTVPVPTYALIDDFEGTGSGTNPGDDSYNIYQVTDQNNHVRDGNWYSTTDSPTSSAVTNYASTFSVVGSAAEFSGTLGSQTSFASFGFSFTNPAGTHNAGVSYYDGTVAGTGNYTGIVFNIAAKNIYTCTNIQSVIVDLVDITAANVMTDHQIAVPVTATYEAVTIFYNQCLSATGVPLAPVSLYQMVFKPQSYGDSGYTYDFAVDNISFTSAAAPAPAAAQGASVIDNFQNGLNETETNWLGAGVTAGYLSDDCDQTAGALCPTFNFGASSQPGFCLASPGPVQVVPGVPSFAAHLSDPNIDYGPPSYLGYLGMGFYFNNAQPAGGTDISKAGTFHQLVFYAKSSNSGMSVQVVMNDNATYQDNCYGASNNYYNIVPTAAWIMYTIDFNPADGAYNLGSPTIASGTNGCSINVASPHNYSYTTAEQISWQPQGSAPTAIDLWVGDIYLQ